MKKLITLSFMLSSLFVFSQNTISALSNKILSHRVEINTLENKKNEAVLSEEKKQLTLDRAYEVKLYERLDKAITAKTYSEYEKLKVYEWEKYSAFKDFQRKKLNLLDTDYQNKIKFVKNKIRILEEKIALIQRKN